MTKRTSIATVAARVKPMVATIDISILISLICVSRAVPLPLREDLALPVPVGYFFTDSSYAFSWLHPLMDGV